MAPGPTPTTSEPEHVQYMRQALAEARKSIPIETAFCVGAVIVSSPDHPTSPSTVLATGYSRELPGNTHAEQCALDKLSSPKSGEATSTKEAGAKSDERRQLLDGASIYTTMEPCSTRLSGNVPCVQRILDTGINRVYIGVEEPRDFVECEGTRLLREAGRQVFVVVDPADPDLGMACLQVARGK
ncbi:hypothetical protein JCM10908_004221 [Rhodotorula pacifica]|uniref:uncharacterized protein n=1 Tax=Rhodotorula pacifica TaxID=1495444 RepID=UPI00316ECFDF